MICDVQANNETGIFFFTEHLPSNIAACVPQAYFAMMWLHWQQIEIWVQVGVISRVAPA